MSRAALFLLPFVAFAPSVCQAQDALPFSTSIDTFHDEEDDILAFAVRLDQPFLAEEFEKSNYIRLKPLNDAAFLIYPSETRFEQRHAEFYGRLRGNEPARLEISYEVVSENPDGSRRVDSRTGTIEIPVPPRGTGSTAIYRTWADFQNDHFAELLKYYPNESFFEYLLLQSRQRYGVTPPSLSSLAPDPESSEYRMYHLFSGGLELQRTLQRSALRGAVVQGDLNIHISQVDAPDVKSLDYATLLEQAEEDGKQSTVQDVAQLIPEDQYLLQFNSWDAADGLYSVSQRWIEPIVRMLMTDARDHGLREKYEQQLGLQFSDLKRLFDNGTITELTISGSDFYVAEGTDLTFLLRTTDAAPVRELLHQSAQAAAEQRADFEDRRFNYRGVSIAARYTTAREISSFVVEHNGWVVISNSHVAIRRVVDTLHDQLPSLADALDYQYVTSLHPPGDDPAGGYFFCSDALLRYLISPEFKIGERRRKQSLNNLIMLNNASLFWRLEYGTAPGGLEDLFEGRFIDRDKLVCPQGGAYSFDASSDSAVSSVFNRIKYLTPIRELRTLKVSSQERQEYDRYTKRYESFWGDYFSPLAVRFAATDNLTADYCLLPFSNSPNWNWLRAQFDEEEPPLTLQAPAESVISSLHVAAGGETLRGMIREVPGVSDVLRDDPTLTDLNWIGDRMSVNFCDTHALVEIDPTVLSPQAFPIPLSTMQQAGVAAAVFATVSPVYVTLDVTDRDKADRFLNMLASRAFLYDGDGMGPLNTEVDSYSLPSYRDSNIYVLTWQIYAARIRLYLSAVGDQLVIATEPGILNEVIDAALADQPDRELSAHMVFQLRFEAMQEFRDDLETYWNEHNRRASHDNIMPLYTLIHLYGVGINDVEAISDAKYGVTYFCPDGTYVYDAERDQVSSTVYGNRKNARQDRVDDGGSSFEETFDSISSVLFSTRVSEDALTGRFEISTR